MNKQQYSERVKKLSPKSNVPYDCFKAFWVGGTICASGEIISVLLQTFCRFDEQTSAVWTSILLVLAGVLLTGLGVYQKIGAYAGAGSIVPITGFANGVSSPAIEFKTEGWVLGLGAKMFVIAGPVIVYGVCTSVLVGFVYYLFCFFW